MARGKENRERLEGDWARGLPRRRVAPAQGIKKAGGPIWPTAQRFIRRLSRLGLPLDGRRSPEHDKAAARSGGSPRCSSEIAHETPLARLPIWQTARMYATGPGPVNGAASSFAIEAARRRSVGVSLPPRSDRLSLRLSAFDRGDVPAAFAHDQGGLQEGHLGDRVGSPPGLPGHPDQLVDLLHRERPGIA
jgi:hypothetical protein